MPVIVPLTARGDVVHKQAKKVLTVVWKDKYEVSLLSTTHNLSMVTSRNWDPHTRLPVIKPECVTDYNTNMQLIGKSDAMISTIDCGRKTLKWYKKFFYIFLTLPC